MNTVTQNIKLQKRVNFVSSYFLQLECGFSDNSITQEAYFLRNGFLTRAIFIRLSFCPLLSSQFYFFFKCNQGRQKSNLKNKLSLYTKFTIKEMVLEKEVSFFIICSDNNISYDIHIIQYVNKGTIN